MFEPTGRQKFGAQIHPSSEQLAFVKSLCHRLGIYNDHAKFREVLTAVMEYESFRNGQIETLQQRLYEKVMREATPSFYMTLWPDA